MSRMGLLLSILFLTKLLCMVVHYGSRDEMSTKEVVNLVYKRSNYGNFVLVEIFVGFGEFGWFDDILLLFDCNTFTEHLIWIIKTCSYQKLG